LHGAPGICFDMVHKKHGIVCRIQCLLTCLLYLDSRPFTSEPCSLVKRSRGHPGLSLLVGALETDLDEMEGNTPPSLTRNDMFEAGVHDRVRVDISLLSLLMFLFF
jgi:hypothetical protein